VAAALTFDTGALINLERGRRDIAIVLQTALDDGQSVIVPAIVVAEWWRTGRHERGRAKLLRMMEVEPLVEHVARLAGHALTLVPGAGAIDAVVMASASLRDDVVYTSDPGDLERLRAAVFQGVLVERA